MMKSCEVNKFFKISSHVRREKCATLCMVQDENEVCVGLRCVIGRRRSSRAWRSRWRSRPWSQPSSTPFRTFLPVVVFVRNNAT